MFRQGDRYRVKEAVESELSRFAMGEVLVFLEASYSRYDSSSAFSFRSETWGEAKTWFLRDDEDDRSEELFEKVK